MTDYIYAIIDDQKRICYVGKSCNPGQRFSQHKSSHKPWIDAIEDPKVIILETVAESDKPAEREQFWINEMKKRGEPVNNINKALNPSHAGTAPDTSLYLGSERRAWLVEHGGIQPTIAHLIDEAMQKS